MPAKPPNPALLGKIKHRKLMQDNTIPKKSSVKYFANLLSLTTKTTPMHLTFKKVCAMMDHIFYSRQTVDLSVFVFLSL